MAFWTGVATVYAVIVAIGIAAGCWLAARFPRRDGRGGRGYDQPAAPRPGDGPSLAAEVPPLGSAFDRLLLPGVFDEDPAALPS